jgi:microcystin-dependent protein
MSSPFVAEIRIWACNFAPTGWAQCSGQLLPISQNTALFSLLGTNFGGDGKSTFGLPNLNGAVPVHCGGSGAGPGLQDWFLGQEEGSDYVTLIESEMPAHNHSLNSVDANGSQTVAGGNQPAKGFIGNIQGNTQMLWYSTANPNAQLAIQAVALTGASQPHNNLMPYLTLLYCIALQGIFPPRG